jgi:hypothetical protein
MAALEDGGRGEQDRPTDRVILVHPGFADAENQSTSPEQSLRAIL